MASLTAIPFDLGCDADEGDVVEDFIEPVGEDADGDLQRHARARGYRMVYQNERVDDKKACERTVQVSPARACIPCLVTNNARVARDTMSQNRDVYNFVHELRASLTC